MPSQKSTYWVFTLNFKGEIPILSLDTRVQYALWQHEYVSHHHLQGFIQMKAQSTLGQMKALIPGAHFEVMKALDSDQARSYAMKEDSRLEGPWEYGLYIKKGSHKRKVMERFDSEPEEMKVEDPSLYRRCLSRKMTEEQRSSSTWDYDLRPWQDSILEAIQLPPNYRDVLWVYGPNGGEGKSTFARHLSLKDGWGYLPGGKTQDMMHLITAEPKNNWVFDIPRVSSDYINYGVIEQVKNRVMVNTKYEPVIMRDDNNPVHVIVFANCLPDVTKLSEDRIKMIYC
ncbi:satellite replication initiator protein [Pea necrotic yellow dwarf alphasatellite 3]|uniref:Satellite replication initiator protein n=1 Tax=Pea necrotic yellow dwarf alphasatellite 3 TaxID=1441798 RepID=V9TQK1_9VIRU|nr:satellite replication initiator protein [Pea necrotic yellow dwarf alphasatellite 3]AHC72280.1 satellite replication initiator protein [Pea necrotic yellow dwarf alphasatellite 3]AVT42661.1 satellite replication initiator protein [Pea necrotic yellow dwarf alphasatellite 3]QJX15719.1 satellite replication initiator protein [Pea necrotic yellow dwarf alphasatellite 3]QJX15720.1 satellite replication initiator protein [Pea necrotic yellow dwarf alphasatellite 3]QJX15721.1 satellite replicatio